MCPYPHPLGKCHNFKKGNKLHILILGLDPSPLPPLHLFWIMSKYKQIFPPYVPFV